MTDTRPLALVTGASSGIGYELAKQFATNGFDVVVNAEDAGITAAAAELTGAGAGASVQPVQADLSTYEGVEQLWSAVVATGRPLAAAALNAGIGRGGPFVETDLTDELQLIGLNITGTTHLAKRVLVAMHTRGEGKVLFTSSIASTMPGSFHAVYNASRSFVQSLSEALQNELKETGITVTALMPGPTDTEFFERADLMDTTIGQGPKDDPAQVARQGFEAMMAGKDKVVGGGLKSKVQAAANAVLPDAVKSAAHRQQAKPRTGE
ncbi:MAG: SDR family NAD(P)-dependent oxidoreductase [Actinomycetota bacterium]|jgi:short-subunit dehydrogenase|nr:SDR family NAD(P)-dependent oxidoreductase [Actinomycetota bacterium]